MADSTQQTPPQTPPQTPQQIPQQVPNPQPEEERPPLQNFIPGQGPTQQAQNTAPGMQPQYPPKPTPAATPKKRGGNSKLLLIAVVVIVVVAIAAFVSLSHLAKPVTTTTTAPTTTVHTIKTASISGCINITSPGRYYLNGNITTKISKGACINIMSSNVELIGNSNFVKGNGPYVDIPPFTYGIEANNVSNVTITGVGVSSFSIGMYLVGISNSNISHNNVTKDIVSGIYLANAYNNVLMQNSVSRISSPEGAVYIRGGGKNLLLNNTISNNAYYGLIVNSTGNTFEAIHFFNNPVDIMCNTTSGYASMNRFSNSTCSINDYCAFAQCSSKNIPPDISSVALQSNINSCGSIDAPGTYILATNINTTDYLNMSNPLSKSVPCILINASNVKLDCKGMSIANGAYGILENNVYNDTVTNCKLYNNTYGIALNNVFATTLENITARNNSYGIYLSNATTGKVSNYSAKWNTYATYLNSSSGIMFRNFSISNNTYGIFFVKGSSNAFSNGKLEQNTKADFYCTAQSYNSTLNLAQSTTCGVTDCNWVSCAQHALPPISVYPISGCTTISASGNYTINNNIIAHGNCFTITASNVNLACNNHILTGSSTGYAFLIDKVKNVSVYNCNITSFSSAFNIANSSFVTISNMSIRNVGSGINLANSSYDKIKNVSLSQFSFASAIGLKGVKNSIIINNTIFDGSNASSSGIMLAHSSNNLVSFNNISTVAYGIEFINSTGNNVFNNTASSSRSYDYYCSGSSTGIYSNINGVNFGSTKRNCTWIVELNPLVPQECYAISSASQITLTGDMLYPYGNTCFSIYNTKSSSANNTLINCNGHTILASHGGIFARIANSTNVKIENCYLKNFTEPIVSSGAYSSIFNNTIATANVSILFQNAKYPKVIQNRILNASYGAVFENTNYGKIYNNSAKSVDIGYEIVGGLGYEIYNNSAEYGSIGMYLINTTINMLGNNNLTAMSKYGIACTELASNSSSLNKDEGGNICSSNSNCLWITSSPYCKP